MTKILLGLAALLAILNLTTSNGTPNGLTLLVMLIAIAAVTSWYHVDSRRED